MRLGASRHGPAAPWAFQFGKNDVFTTTGTPTRDTWKAIESTFSSSPLTVTFGSGRGVTLSAAATLAARVHCAGPSAANGRSRSPSIHHGAATHSQGASSGSCARPAGAGVP